MKKYLPMQNLKPIFLCAIIIALFSITMFEGCKKETTTATPTCADGIKNGTETDVDCGGTCNACPTCSDGIKNQNEIGIDCGGVCNRCYCADGYEGDSCQTLSYHKYLALNTSTSEQCTVSPPFTTANVFFTWVGPNANEIHIHNLMGSNCVDVLAMIGTDATNQGNILTISPQYCGANSISGQGTYNPINHSVTLNLNYFVSGTVYTCSTILH